MAEGASRAAWLQMSRLLSKLHNCNISKESDALNWWDLNPWFNGEFEKVLIPGTIEYWLEHEAGDDPNQIINPIEMSDLKSHLSNWE